MKRGLAVIGLVAAIVCAVAAPAGAANFRECPVSGVMAKGSLETQGLRCGPGRAIILGFMSKSARQGVTHARVRGFRCKNVQPSNGPGIVCRRGNRLARFLGFPNV